jgi:hypothetical protein
MNTLVLAILAVASTALGRFIYKAYLWRRHAATLASQQDTLISGYLPLTSFLTAWSTSSPNLRSPDGHGRSLTSLSSSMCKSNSASGRQGQVQSARFILPGSMAIVSSTLRHNPSSIQ